MSKDVIFSFSYFGLNRTKKEKSAILNDWRLFQPGSRCLWVFVWLNTSSSLSDKLHTEMVFFLPGVEFKCLPTGERNLSASLCFIWLLLCVTADTSALWFTGICFCNFWCDVRKTYWARNKSCQAFFFMKLIWILTSCCGGRVYNLYLKWNSLQNAT